MKGHSGTDTFLGNAKENHSVELRENPKTTFGDLGLAGGIGGLSCQNNIDTSLGDVINFLQRKCTCDETIIHTH